MLDSVFDDILVKASKYLTSVKTRDRFLKIFQYTVRFIIIYSKKKQVLSKDIIKKFVDLLMTISNSRKFFRVLSPLTFAKNVLDIISTKNIADNPINIGSQIAAQTLWGIFFFTGSVLLYQRLMYGTEDSNILRNFISTLIAAESCSLISVVTSLRDLLHARAVIEIEKTQQKENEVHTSSLDSKLNSINAQISDHYVQFVKVALNLFVAVNVHPNVKLLMDRLLYINVLLVKDFVVSAAAIGTSVFDICQNA